MCEKICVFDLDGTLWNVNSHVDIIQLHTKMHRIGKLADRITAFLFPDYYQKYLDGKFAVIPEEYVNQYAPPFKKSAISILVQKQAEGFKILCISSAPQEIINTVGKRLNIEVYHAPIGEKEKVLLDKYPEWKELVIVTDNLTDRFLLELSDEAYIYTNARRRKTFMEMNIKGIIHFLDVYEV